MTLSLPSPDEARSAITEIFDKTFVAAGDEILSALLVIGRDIPGPNGETYKSIDYVSDDLMAELCRSTRYFQDLVSATDDPVVRTRLHVLMYCRIIEADFPYLLLLNLLRLLDGEDPSDVFTVKRRKKGGSTAYVERKYPKEKIPALKERATVHGLKIGDVLEELWHRDLRNAFSHSQFIIHEDGAFWGTGALSLSSRFRRHSGCNFTADFIQHLSLALRELLSQITIEYEAYIRPYTNEQPHRIKAGLVQWDAKRSTFYWVR